MPSFDQVMRILEHITWPVIILIAFAMLRPWRLVVGSPDRPGTTTLNIGTAGLSIKRQISRAHSATEGAKPVNVPAQEPGPLAVDEEANEASIDSYSLIMASWSELASVFDQALKTAGVPRRDISWKAPARMLSLLQDKGILSDSLRDAAAELLDVRNQVRRNGAGRFSGLGITSNDAQQFYGSTRILRAVVEHWLAQHGK
jgi:hypothetical protein